MASHQLFKEGQKYLSIDFEKGKYAFSQYLQAFSQFLLAELPSHNLIAGEFYGIGISAGRISGEAIEQSSNRFKEAYEREELYVNGLLNENIVGEALYFTSINWLYQTSAGENIAKSILWIVSQRQAEVITKITTQRDYIFGMLKKLNITGVSVDVGMDSMVVNPIDGDATKDKEIYELNFIQRLSE